METIILSIITAISVIFNALVYRRYTNTKNHLIESEERVKDLDMVVSALQSLQAFSEEAKPKTKSTKKRSKPVAKITSKKEVTAPKKRGRKPNS